jgi:hypothetical protein
MLFKGRANPGEQEPLGLTLVFVKILSMLPLQLKSRELVPGAGSFIVPVKPVV